MSNEESDLERSLREKAEELLKKKREENELMAFESDQKKLIHELQVHQIELEMQNDELRKANETAETALKKYTLLFDLAPMGYFIIEGDGTICELNFTAADMLGEKRFSLVNSNLKLFISSDSLSAFNNFLSKVFINKTKEWCQVDLSHDNNYLCRVYMEGIVTGEDERCLLSVLDIFRINESLKTD